MAQRFRRVLRNYMRKNGLSGPVAAERFGVTHGTIGNWLGGTHVPPRSKSRLVAQVMGRADVVDIIDSDRAAMRGAKQGARAGSATGGA